MASLSQLCFLHVVEQWIASDVITSAIKTDYRKKKRDSSTIRDEKCVIVRWKRFFSHEITADYYSTL